MARATAKGWGILLTCEHGGAKVPRPYLAYFSDEERALLKTHRGWDAGALIVAKKLKRSLKSPLLYAEVSRLLVDLNRSAHHPLCLGPSFRALDPAIKAAIMEAYYWPYRLHVEATLQQMLREFRGVLHFAVHSFTPVLNGAVRTAEIGLLYDPARRSEKIWADALHQELKHLTSGLRIRRNYPYLGKSDGLTRALRQKFSAKRYAGLELEINQSLVDSPSQLSELSHSLAVALRATLKNLAS